MYKKQVLQFPSHPTPATPADTGRTVIKPLALLEVVRRRGRSWGLLAQYEESRLGLPR